MFSMLVVDDEEFAVLGITQAIKWGNVGITKIFKAYGVSDAMEILKSEHIDIAICDIEMPGKSGIDLISWIEQNSFKTKTIILTGHANFKYAKKALQLDCCDYLLKPVEHDLLKQAVEKVLEQIIEEKKYADRIEIYNKYQKLWESQKPYLVEHFWQDIVRERIQPDTEDFAESLGIFGIPMDISFRVLMVLINVEQWMEEINASDKNIMGFAIRNIANEIILEGLNGVVVQDHHENGLVIIYLDHENEVRQKMLENRCDKFIQLCNDLINCHLSCYIGEQIDLLKITASYKELLKVEYDNINKSNSVMFQGELKERQNCVFKVPGEEWELLLETGKKRELLKRVRDYINSIEGELASRETLQSLFFRIVNMIYIVFHKNGISVNDVLNSALIDCGHNMSSTFQLDTWAVSIISEAVDYINTVKKSESVLVSEIKNYIEKNNYNHFSREHIANALHFNSDYISRVFKKETGIILSDYIVFCRVKAAKKLLEETNDKIADIALSLGYTSFSHFAKVFKNGTGMTPQEYRKMYKKLM